MKYFASENCKLVNADCLEFMKTMDDGCVSLTVTSPPYDNLRTYEGECDWNFDIFKKVADELYRVTEPGGVVVWVIGDSTVDGSETGSSFKQALYFKEIGFNIHDTMIWNKGSFAFPSKNCYHQVFEYMFVFSKGKPKTMNFIMDRENKYVCTRGASGRKRDGTRNTGTSTVRNKYGKRFNIWNYPIGGGNSASDKIAFEHPAIFPEGLANDHIVTWSNVGDVIFDPFMGSGTTGKMALLNNRKFIGVDKVEKYYTISFERLVSNRLIYGPADSAQHNK